MGNAVVVTDAYKKFGKPGEPLWKRLLHGKGAIKVNHGNGIDLKNGIDDEQPSAALSRESANGNLH